MKFIRYCFLLLALSASFNSFAQTLYDVLYLKNGSKLVGTIIEQQPGSSIKFKDLKGNVYLFAPDEVDRMSREQAPVEEKSNKFTYADVRSAKWFIGFFAGYSGAPVEYREYNYSYYYDQVGTYQTAWRHMATVQVTAGYRFSPAATIGLNVGGVINKRLRLMPIMVEGSYAFLKKKVSPYVSVAGGYAIGFRDPDQNYPIGGGAAATGRLGVKAYVAREIALVFDVGYRAQQRFLFFPDRWFHGVETRVGFVF